MKPVVLCISAMILLSGRSLGLEVLEGLGWKDKIRLCGRDLADAVHHLCEGEHYDPQNEVGVNRRSLRQHRPAFGSVHAWLLSQSTSHSSEVENYRNLQRRGIVDECCRSIAGCSMEVIAQYCG